MGSPSFGLAPGNNAPPPMGGSFTNPTGGSYGGQGGGFNFPLYSTTSGTVSPMANMPTFSGTGGLQNLSSGITLTGDNWKSLDHSLGEAFGSGAGDMIYQLLTKGMFNPQVAGAFLNAMQPGEERGRSNILQAFGSEGSRFGSAAALGLGDYNSQVNLNEQQTLASMYMQAQQQQLSLLEGIAPTLHAEQANKGSWIDDLLGGLEIAGGIAAAPFTGGMSLGLTGMGVGTLSKGLTGGGGGGSSPMPFGGFGVPGIGYGNTGTFGANAPSFSPLLGGGGADSFVNEWMLNEQSSSAGSLLGGSTSPTNPMFF